MILPTPYQQYIYLSKYSRWRDGDRRRETWDETVGRYFGFFVDHLGDRFPLNDYHELYDTVVNLDVMPSMRCLMTAGPALARDNVAGYNCAYTPINRPSAFDEILFILMCGTGVGFSVERQYVSRLPQVAETFDTVPMTIVVRDSKRGWAEALRTFINCLYSGKLPQVDFSKIRPAGSRLKKMGGQASGPEPLKEVFRFAERLFVVAAGRRLTSLEAHDLVCKIAECVVVGGVRRSALLSLSNLSDVRMREAKSGRWWEENPQRALANNSVCYTERSDAGQFMAEWLELYRSRSGERGIFNRLAAQRQANRYGKRDATVDYGTNPCSEIILRPNQFCNLSEVVCRANDDFNDLARKVMVATILGTWQSTLTNFRYLSREWQRNCEAERLLGVSLTGIMDCESVRLGSETLRQLREIAIETNQREAARLGISPSVAITCVKPSGTVSQLVNSSSGIHSRYALFYIRRTRELATSPIAQLLMESGMPFEKDVTLAGHVVFSWPVRAPRGSICDEPALTQLERWKMFQDHWCDHKPSVTISVAEGEWPEVGAWVWKHFDDMSGVSFLPKAGNHTYQQAPFEAVDGETIERMEAAQPKIDWRELEMFEKTDTTESSRELACSAGGQCEI